MMVYLEAVMEKKTMMDAEQEHAHVFESKRQKRLVFPVHDSEHDSTKKNADDFKNKKSKG